MLVTGYRLYDYFTGDGPILGVMSASVISISSFYWSRKYSKNASDIYPLTTHISRNEDTFTFIGIHDKSYSKTEGVKVAADRLSILSIRDDYLSVIIDGNGNGWDFFVLGSASEIEAHLRSLLSIDEQALITFKQV